MPPAVTHVQDLAGMDDAVHAAGLATSGLLEEVHEPLDDGDRRATVKQLELAIKPGFGTPGTWTAQNPASDSNH
jgi:hypothetical protein